MGKENNERGFSAIEVILVIAIVGLVGFMGWIYYNNQMNNDNATPMQTSENKSEDSSLPNASQVENPTTSPNDVDLITIAGKQDCTTQANDTMVTPTVSNIEVNGSSATASIGCAPSGYKATFTKDNNNWTVTNRTQQ